LSGFNAIYYDSLIILKWLTSFGPPYNYYVQRVGECSLKLRGRKSEKRTVIYYDL